MNAQDKGMVGIDTMLLIHAYREKFSDDHQRENHLKAKALLDNLAEDGVRVCISIITVAEYLAGIEMDFKQSIISELEQAFTIAPFTNRAAILASCLVPEAKKLVNSDREHDRPLLLADAKILASLLVHGCKRIQSVDVKFSKLAETQNCSVNSIKIQPMLDGLELPDLSRKKPRKGK